MTAKEFLETLPKDSNWKLSNIVENAMIEFAKYHVEQALKYASEEAVTINYGQNVSKDSILDAYPLENIK